VKDSKNIPQEDLCYVFDYFDGFYIASARNLKVPQGMPMVPSEQNSSGVM
jgi:hypothetical protein